MPTGVSPVGPGVLVLGVLGGLLMLLAEVTTVISIDVATGSCEFIYESDPELADDCSQKGFERHGGALALLGALTLAMAAGAGLGGSRPAGVALIGIGVVVLALTLLRDLPASDDTGLIGRRYAEAEATAGIGLWFELAGGVLAVFAGALRVTRS